MDPAETPSEALAPIARLALQKILQAYGRAPAILDFFNIYGELQKVYEDPTEPRSGDLYARFSRSSRQLYSRIDSEATRSRLETKSTNIIPLLHRLDGGGQIPDSMWRSLVSDYSDLIQSVASDKGVYLTPRKLPGTSPVRWIRLQKASPKEESVEQLRLEDPDLYERTMRSREQRRELNKKISDKIVAAGMTPEIKSIMGRPMNVGVNDVGETYVFDEDGDVLAVEEFVSKIRAKEESQGLLRSVNVPLVGGNTPKDLDQFRKVSPEEIASELMRPDFEGEVHYIALTDDPNKSNSLTRIYPVRKYNGQDVVVSGRFQGMYASDLVNAVGRQIEGSLSYYDPATRRITLREIKRGRNGKVEVRQQREPYVTVDQGRLFLQLYGGAEFTEIRRNMKALKIPSVQYVEGSWNRSYYFEPKDFAAIREVIGGMALSSTAAKLLQNYFDELTKAEQAANAKNLARYSPEALGLKLPLRGHVKKALAWLDANGNKGICALDTGMGKTVTAVSAMQNLINKGMAGNGRFLYVCEKALVGNLPFEISKFLPPEGAAELIKRVDVKTYPQLNRLRRQDPSFGEDYIAIFFDEAHLRMRSKSQSSYKTSVAIKNKNKILMTASPMVSSPREVFTMASVASGLDLNTSEGQAQERSFTNRFSETVGGRVVGITRDPVASRDFRVWVKRNLYFADKRYVDEDDARLGDLRVQTVPITMPPEVALAYQKAMDELLPALKELSQARFSGRDEFAFEALSRRIGKPLRTLTALSNTPDQIVPGAENPKLEQAVRIVEKAISGRTLLFTDSVDFATETWHKMGRAFPGKWHIIGYSDQIVAATPTGEEIKYTQRRYLDPSLPGGKTQAADWKTHVLSKILGCSTTRVAGIDVATAVLTASYAVGQNLQSFDTVIHLDRDDWNSETMKQRTARAWRAGNKAPVDEYTLDMVYPTFGGEQPSKTLDEIRRVVQEIDSNLFDRVVIDSQVEKLGLEWLEIKKSRSALYAIDKKMMERTLSPYVDQLAQQENSG